MLILVIVLAPKAQNLTQSSFELSPELLICSCVYEGVYGATKVKQEPVCKVSLTRKSGFPLCDIDVVHYTSRKPATRKTEYYCCQSLGHFCFFHVRSELLQVVLERENSV